MDALRITNYQSSQLDDTVVVRRIIAGEKELFEILLRRYNQTLYRVVRSYLKDPAEIEDAMQNAYMKAYDKLSQFKGEAAFSTWLIRIGINEALLRLKVLKKQKVVPFNDLDVNDLAIHQISDKQVNPEKAIIRQEAQQMLEAAIDSLPEKYRVIYVLKEIEGLTNSEISVSLGITDSNMKVRLHRARTLLKESLYQLSTPAKIFEFGNKRCDAMVQMVMKAI